MYTPWDALEDDAIALAPETEEEASANTDVT
jgi:hypothetical protein